MNGVARNIIQKSVNNMAKAVLIMMPTVLMILNLRLMAGGSWRISLILAISIIRQKIGKIGKAKIRVVNPYRIVPIIVLSNAPSEIIVIMIGRSSRAGRVALSQIGIERFLYDESVGDSVEELSFILYIIPYYGGK